MSEWYCAWCGGMASMMGHYSDGFYLGGVHYKLPDGAHTCSPEFTRLIEETWGTIVAQRYREQNPEREHNELAHQQDWEGRRYT